LVLAGCRQSALINLKHETNETEQRIAIKQRQLEDLENQKRILMEEKESLVSKLGTKEMTLNQLSESLDKLQRENARIRADTDRQQKEKVSLEMQIQQYRDEIDALRNNKQLSVEEKRKRIEELKEKIRAYLEMGLK
jgi:chromosome segregation ATPase